MNNIIYSDKKKVEKILEEIGKSGVNKLHILADFDRTLTKAFSKGKKRSSLISILRSEGYLSSSYREEAYKLFDYYNPIEIDPNIPLDIKIKEMSIWWQKHLSILVKSGLNIKDIKKISTSGIIKLRKGTKKLLKYLDQKNIPLLIISANGLGTDSIKLYLESEKTYFKNIRIISNSFKWNNEGNAIGFDSRVIHTFNKGETVLEDFPEIYDIIRDKKNVILLGDSLGDPHMIDGFEYNNLLKIGFLNEKEEELLSSYLEKYDVIITGDGNMDFLNEFIIKCF